MPRTGPLPEAAEAAVPDAPAGRRLAVPAIDGFRGLAALAVVLYHVSYGSGTPPLGSGLLRSIFISGYMGVDFFFVISGFVLFLPTVTGGGRFGNVRAYGLRRAARIVPAYYVVLAVTVVALPLLSPNRVPVPWSSVDGAASFLLHLTFLQHSLGAARLFAEGFMVLGVIWTLTLEVAFYLLLPLVARWYFRHPFVGLAVALGISLAWKAWAVHAAFTIGFLPGTSSTPLLRLILVTQFPTYMAHFALGMTAAWLFVRWRRADAPWAAWAPWAAAAVQVVAAVALLAWMRAAGLRDLAATAGPFDHWTGTFPVAVFFAVLLLATVLAPRWSQRPMTNRVARRYGDVSYGVYLWHIPVIGLALTTFDFAPDGATWSFLRLLALAGGASYVLASASLAWVERPAIRWARRRSQRLAPAEVGLEQAVEAPPIGLTHSVPGAQIGPMMRP